MDSDSVRAIWRSQSPMFPSPADVERLLADIQRRQKQFDSALFWRDVREISLGLALAPAWVCLGLALSLPWTWHLSAPVLLWISGFLAVFRQRDRRRSHDVAEPLRTCVEASLTQVERQIWLLRNVGWWALAPFAGTALAFIFHVGWSERWMGWPTAAFSSVATMVLCLIFAGVYWVNQAAVASVLKPRHDELKAVLENLVASPLEGEEASPSTSANTNGQ